MFSFNLAQTKDSDPLAAGGSGRVGLVGGPAAGPLHT